MTVLIKFEAARQALAEARSIDEVKQVRDQAEALRLYVKQQDMGLEMQNDIAIIKLRAERRAGELLAEMEKHKGGRPTKTGDIMSPVSPPTLADLGIHKKQAERWQLEAEVPEEDFEQYVAKTKAKKEELTSVGLRRLAQKLKQKEESQTTQINVLEFEQSKKYCTIVIDPPWPIKKILRDVRQNQGVFDYPAMTVEEIGKLPISDLGDSNGCHIYLWVTHKFLPTGLQLFEQWGVKYQCIMTWVKNVGFTPFSWMYSTEHVLFGRIGSLSVQRKGIRLDFQAKVREHSRKPDIFYERVREASPEPRIDLFSREKREGFDQWGKEKDKFNEK